jgi:prepilin-type N-terminal cleavage/methylation domain-containing protein
MAEQLLKKDAVHYASPWPVYRARRDDGFTLIEVLVAVTIVGLLAGTAILQFEAMRPTLLGDGAMRVVMAQMNQARESAVAQRRRIDVEFIGTNRLRVVRQDQPSGTTVLNEVGFESGVQYGLISGVGDTPDAFGRGSATYFGSTSVSRVTFGSDGALVDNGGNPINGTVFLTVPNTPRSFRAVTVLGSTGRVRAYRWDGRQWTRV